MVKRKVRVLQQAFHRFAVVWYHRNSYTGSHIDGVAIYQECSPEKVDDATRQIRDLRRAHWGSNQDRKFVSPEPGRDATLGDSR